MALTGGCVLLALLGVPFVALVMPSLEGVLLVATVLGMLVAMDVLLAPGRKHITLQRGQVKTPLHESTGQEETAPSPEGAESTPATAQLDNTVRLGQQAQMSVKIHNTSRWPTTVLVRDLWVPSAGCAPHHHRLRLPARRWRWVTFTLSPTRRGERPSSGLSVRSIGPLHLGARQWKHSLSAHLRVLPAFSSRRHLPSRLALLQEIEGSVAVLRKGQGSEFDSLRDYVIGDDVRAIDWMATARHRQVVVRTWRPERDRRVVIVLDTSRTCAARIGRLTPAPGDDARATAHSTRLDALIDAALLLSVIASQAGDRVDLLAYDTGVRTAVRGARPPQLLPSVVNALCQVQPRLVEANMHGLVSTVLSWARRRSLVVLLTSVEPANIRDGLLPVLGHLTARHTVMVASVVDPRLQQMANAQLASSGCQATAVDVKHVYERASAAISADGARTVAQLLRRGNAEVVSASPDDLAPAVADRYLALKAAGRL